MLIMGKIYFKKFDVFAEMIYTVQCTSLLYILLSMGCVLCIRISDVLFHSRFGKHLQDFIRG